MIKSRFVETAEILVGPVKAMERFPLFIEGWEDECGEEHIFRVTLVAYDVQHHYTSSHNIACILGWAKALYMAENPGAHAIQVIQFDYPETRRYY